MSYFLRKEYSMFNWMNRWLKKPLNVMRGQIDASLPTPDAFLVVTAEY